MDKTEARGVLHRKVQELAQRTYGDLRKYLDTTEEAEVAGPSGRRYRLHIYACWDRKPEGNLRVWVEVAEGMFPLTEDFLMAPDNSRHFPIATPFSKMALRATILGLVVAILGVFVAFFLWLAR